MRDSFSYPVWIFVCDSEDEVCVTDGTFKNKGLFLTYQMCLLWMASTVFALGSGNGYGLSVEHQEPCRGGSKGTWEEWACSKASALKWNQRWCPHFTGQSKAHGHF